MSKYGNPSPLFLFWSKLVYPSLSQVQGGRRAFAEKFVLRRKYATLSQYWVTDTFTPFLGIVGQRIFFLAKTVFLGQELHYYMVYTAYYAELNLQILITPKPTHLSRK